MGKLRFNLARVIIAAANFILIMLPFNVYGETQSSTLFVLSEQSNMAITIYYDSEKPEVSFVAPDGTVLLEDEIFTETADKAVCYYIPDAPAGEWSILYDKGLNKELDVRWAPYVNAVQIKEFAFTHPGGIGDIEAVFHVESDVDGLYNYAVYAAITDENGDISGKRKLDDGVADLNQDAAISVRTDGLQTYSSYRLFLDVWRTEYGLEASDTFAAQETFSITNVHAYEAVENVYAEVNMSGSILMIDWSEYQVSCDEYVVGIFDTSNDAEPLYANSFIDGTTTTAVSYPDDIETIRVELSYIKGSRTSQLLSKEIMIKNGVQFTFPGNDVVASKQLTVDYETKTSIFADVEVNGRVGQILLDGKGNFSVELDDFDNLIKIKYSINDDTTVYYVENAVSYDNAPPLLILPEHDITLSVTGEYFDLVGATEQDCTVTVGGEAVTVNLDGTFLKTIPLIEGDNEFIVNASDIAGNVSSQLVVIHRMENSEAVSGEVIPLPAWKRYMPLIVSFACSMAILFLVLLFTKLYLKRKAVSPLSAVLTVARDVFLLLTLISIGIVGFAFWKYMELDKVITSEKLFDVAGDSVSRAYDMIRQAGVYKRILSSGLIFAGIGAGVFIGTFLLDRFIKRKRAAEALPAESAQLMKYACPNCGEEYDEPILFCGRCGHKM